jgi:hypothetical protein
MMTRRRTRRGSEASQLRLSSLAALSYLVVSFFVMHLQRQIAMAEGARIQSWWRAVSIPKVSPTASRRVALHQKYQFSSGRIVDNNRGADALVMDSCTLFEEQRWMLIDVRKFPNSHAQESRKLWLKKRVHHILALSQISRD